MRVRQENGESRLNIQITHLKFLDQHHSILNYQARFLIFFENKLFYHFPLKKFLKKARLQLSCHTFLALNNLSVSY